MPCVIVKFWSGKSKQKQKLAGGVTEIVRSSLGYGAASVFVALEDVPPGDRTEKVDKPDILHDPGTLCKRPSYDPL